MVLPSLRKHGISRTMWEDIVRPAVLKRDNYQCTKCGNKEELHVHHIIRKLHVFSNFITLCKSCHNNIDKKGAYITYYGD